MFGAVSLIALYIIIMSKTYSDLNIIQTCLYYVFFVCCTFDILFSLNISLMFSFVVDVALALKLDCCVLAIYKSKSLVQPIPRLINLHMYVILKKQLIVNVP